MSLVRFVAVVIRAWHTAFLLFSGHFKAVQSLTYWYSWFYIIYLFLQWLRLIAFIYIYIYSCSTSSSPCCCWVSRPNITLKNVLYDARGVCVQSWHIWMIYTFSSQASWLEKKIMREEGEGNKCLLPKVLTGLSHMVHTKVGQTQLVSPNWILHISKNKNMNT